MRVLAICTALVLFAILSFYLPMRRAFWNNTDEGEMLYLSNTSSLPQMIAASNRYENRPLEMLGVVLAQQFTPDALDGFLWLALMLRAASALLLWGIVTSVTRNDAPGMIAALLFMVNPSEPWRYIAIVMMDYYLALFLLLLSVWLYLISYLTQRRWLLTLACLSLIGTLLVRESALLIAPVVPILLFCVRPQRSGRRLWFGAWIATWAIMCARLIVFLLTTPGSYQSDLGSHVTSFGQAVTNVVSHLAPSFSYLDGMSALPAYWRYGLACALIAAAILSLSRERTLNRRYWPGLPLVVAGIVLSVAPYYAFSETARTQFFAAPLQAVFWTLVIALIGALLAPRWQRPWLMLATGVLILSAVAGAWQYQDNQRQNGPSLERIISVFDQVHRLAPAIAPHSLILFVMNGRPFGERNFQLIALSRLTLGVDAYQTEPPDLFGNKPIFTADGVTLPLDPTEPADRVTHYPYSQVIAFGVEPDFNVSLLPTLPSALLPTGIARPAYDPYARIATGTPSVLRFLHFSSWMNDSRGVDDGKR